MSRTVSKKVLVADDNLTRTAIVKGVYKQKEESFCVYVQFMDDPLLKGRSLSLSGSPSEKNIKINSKLMLSRAVYSIEKDQWFFLKITNEQGEIVSEHESLGELLKKIPFSTS